MNNLNFMLNMEDVSLNVEIIKTCFIIMFTFYIFIRIVNIKEMNIKRNIIGLLCVPIIAIIAIYEKHKSDSYQEVLVLVTIIAIINSFILKKDLIFSLLVTIISFSINYIIYMISLTLAFVPNAIFKIGNDYLALTIILLIYGVLFINIIKIKKFRHGLSFLQKKLEDTYLNILILNIGVIVLFLAMVIQDPNILMGRKIVVTFTIIAIIMFLTIKQSFDLYYKQNLLTKDLEQTKAELEEKKKEISKLEKENLKFSKSSHSLAHKQKSLEYKLEKLMKTGVDEKSKEAIKQEIQNISKEVYKEPQQIELPKTEIESIDDMFSYMQSECIKDNIKFELQIVGNPFYMINHLISESELEILLADHIKDAIIAINYSDNTNRSILVRIGKIDNVYSLYIYDSGIEFEKEVLENLGKKPITTHADSGGTGMGFMNTFDTLNRTKASLIINEIGKPCIDNYTKVLIFKFDNKNEFIVNSYKSEVAVV